MRAAVVGGGTMGVGIAYVMAAAGIATTVVEPRPERRAALVTEIDAALAEGEKRGKLSAEQAISARQALTLVATLDQADAGLDLIVETVPERLDLKKSVLRQIEAKSPLLIASNTSSLSIDILAGCLQDPSRFLGLHFFNPVWSIPLVEVVRGRTASQATVDRALAFVKAIRKESAVVADSPGFATSRLDLIFAMESIRMVEEGVASAQDIDRAVRLAYRHPVGPLMLSDIVGLDVRLDIARQLEAALGDRFAPPRLLIDMVAQGRLGKKSGAGFYDWE